MISRKIWGKAKSWQFTRLISRIFFAKLTGRNWIVFTFNVFDVIIGLVGCILEHSVRVAGSSVICRIEKTIFHGCPSNLLLLTTHDTMNKTRRIPCKGRVSRKKEASAPDGFLFRLLCSGLHTTTPPTTKLLVRMLQYYSLDFLFHQTEVKKIAQCWNLRIFLHLKFYGKSRVSKSGNLTQFQTFWILVCS